MLSVRLLSRMQIAVMVAAIAIFGTPACGKGARHALVVADSGLYEILSDVHQVEQTALCGFPSCAGHESAAPTIQGWTLAKSQSFNQKLLPAVEGGRSFNALLKAWVPGTPMPAQIHQTIQGISQSLGAVTADFPDGATKAKILGNLAQATQIVINGVDLVLAVKGGS